MGNGNIKVDFFVVILGFVQDCSPRFLVLALRFWISGLWFWVLELESQFLGPGFWVPAIKKCDNYYKVRHSSEEQIGHLFRFGSTICLIV